MKVITARTWWRLFQKRTCELKYISTGFFNHRHDYFDCLFALIMTNDEIGEVSQIFQQIRCTQSLVVFVGVIIIKMSIWDIDCWFNDYFQRLTLCKTVLWILPPLGLSHPIRLIPMNAKQVISDHAALIVIIWKLESHM